MKHKIFYIDDNILIEYLEKYGRGMNTKDYEFFISILAKKYFENKLKQSLIITFEANNKSHHYPDKFKPNLEQLREILTSFIEEDTPVDFALAPIDSTNFKGYAYPFQLKRFYSELSQTTIDDLANFINDIANGYDAKDVSLIIVPLLKKTNDKDEQGYSIKELVDKLDVNDKNIHAVYLFQYVGNIPKFITLWVSSRALKEKKD